MSTTEDRYADLLEPDALGIDLMSAPDDGSPVLFLRGEIDAATVGRLEDGFDALLAEGGVRTVTIGFGEVTFMDSSGINAVLDLRNRLGTGGRIHLRDCSPSVRRVCDITGLGSCEELTIS